MTRLYVFADEAGCFEFSKKNNVSKYFILCSVCLDSCDVGPAMLDLRRDMGWRRLPLGDCFHASTDQQAVRDEVFKLICKFPFQVHATIMEKSKAQPQVRKSKPRFYQYGWYYHFKYATPKFLKKDTELLVTTASLGTKKERASFTGAVDDVIKQTVRTNKYVTMFTAAQSDPCIQVADYCAWAIQRKWERQDERSYALIKDRITYEYDLWKTGTTHYY